MDQWETALYDEQDPEIKQLANDLIKYGFIMDGYNFTQTSYLHLVPTEFWASTEGFSEFKRIGIAEEHIALFTALNNPSAFIETFYDSSFSHTKIEDLQKLVYAEEEGVTYYLPAYAKKNGDQWDIYLNTDYVNSNYTNNSYLGNPTYTKLVWKNPDIQGRTYKIDAFGMEDLNINVKTVVTPNKLVEDKVDANKNLENMTNPKAKYRIPMNFEDGTGGRRMRDEFKGKSTLELIKEGNRTATSRDRSQPYSQQDIKVGDIIEFYAASGKSKGESVFVRATTAPYKLSEVTAEQWSKLEGWRPDNFESIKNKGYEQFQYELMPTASQTLKEEFPTSEAKDILDQTPDTDPTKTPDCYE